MEIIITVLIGSSVTLLLVLIARGKDQAVTETKLYKMTREVREHNHFTQRMTIVGELRQ